MPIKKGKLMNNPDAIAERFKISFAEHCVVPACARMTGNEIKFWP